MGKLTYESGRPPMSSPRDSDYEALDELVARWDREFGDIPDPENPRHQAWLRDMIPGGLGFFEDLDPVDLLRRELEDGRIAYHNRRRRRERERRGRR